MYYRDTGAVMIIAYVPIKLKGQFWGGLITAYNIVDNDFWGLAKWNNIWAIQYGTANVNDQVEYRDETPHASWTDANLGDFSDFISWWDSAHLAKLQADWDADVLEVYSGEGPDAVLESTESEADQIARKGARPTSYSSE